nr:hypothetical protein [Candidatus Hamiltonella defensa]
MQGTSLDATIGTMATLSFSLFATAFAVSSVLPPPAPTTTEVCSLNAKPAKRAISF